jgi:cadmium resistance protein CadD (predicted permease)
MTVTAVTFANGGDNIGVYVPVFTSLSTSELAVYVLTFLVLVAVWCVAGYALTSRPAVANMLSRWGHVVLPIVLITLGVIILVEGHAFGL